MEEKIYHCDIKNREHSREVKKYKVPVMFDHDQEDGKSKTEPYYETYQLDLCKDCYCFMLKEHKIIYAYGAMGYNTYTL
jgi:hypothetical protein